MDVVLAILGLSIFMAGAVLIARAEQRRTPASLAREQAERRNLTWFFTRRFNTLDELDPTGRRLFRLGRTLILGAALFLYIWFVLRRR